MLETHKGVGMTASNHTAVEVPKRPVRPRKPRRTTVPDDFAKALAREPRAAAFFEKLGAEHRRGVLCRRGRRVAVAHGLAVHHVADADAVEVADPHARA